MKPSTTWINNIHKQDNINKGYNLVQKLIIYAIWILLWQGVYITIGNEVLVPSPMGTFVKFFQMLSSDELYIQLMATLGRVFFGVTFSLIGGSISGYIAYNNQFFKELIKPMISFMKATPVMAIIILAILWFDSGYVPIFVCVLMCYPIIYTNVLSGLMELDNSYKELSIVYKVKKSIYLKECIYPQLKPYIRAGLVLGVGMAYKVVIASEILSIPKHSIGYELLDAKIYLETTEIFAWIIIIMILSQISEYFVKRILRERN